MCFINVLFKVITNLTQMLFYQDDLQKNFCIIGRCLMCQRNPQARPEILHTLDPSFLSFPALSAGAYTTTLVVMEAVVS